MESLLNRYRNITVLLLVIMAQLVLLAVSAKNDQDVRFIRIWTVTAVTPVARIIEGLRGGGTGFLHNYILLHDTHQENLRLRAELDKFKMENVFLRNELNTAERAKALSVFQAHTPSKSIAARVIGTGAGANSKAIYVDRGTAAGVQRGMAVVTPDGIVGKVIAAYPTASQVLLITDGDFAAGVITQKGVRGTLKGQGTPQCKVDYVAFEEKVEPGELLFTSGDDRIFPRGFPVGVIKVVRPAQPFKEILAEPSGLQRGLEDVLILIEGVHQIIPEAPSGMQPVYIAPPPPGNEAKPADAGPAPKPIGTEADRLRTQYQQLGEEQNHKYGENPPGTKPIDFTKLGGRGLAPAAAQPPAAQPPGAGTPPPEVKPEVKPAVPPVAKPVTPANPPLPAGRGPGAADASRRNNQTAGAPPGGQHPE
ncbi:MAG TPA: rod shape-determining protein MreC [Candidatus Solibacter sp.]